MRDHPWRPMTYLEFAVFDFLRQHIIGRREPGCVSLAKALKAEQPEIYPLAIAAGPVPAVSHAQH